MRLLIVSIVLCVIGAGLGQLLTSAEFRGVREQFEPNSGVGSNDQEQGLSDIIREQGKNLPPTAGALVEILHGEVHDFGRMERDSEASHEFIIRNGGSKILKLAPGGSSCPSCTVGSISRKEIPPGESGTVTIKWKTATPDLEYRKEAYILTNDPNRQTIILTIKGKVIQSLRLDSDDIAFGSISTTDSRTASTRLFCYREDAIEFQPPQYSNTEIAEFFTTTVQPLPAADVAEREGAVSGFEIIATIKPGLPLGTILQTVRIETNLADITRIEIPLRGTVVSDISVIAGKLFDSTSNVFRLDVIPRGQGKKVAAQIAVKGAERNNVRLKLKSVTPESSLKVTIGEPKEVGTGTVVLYPLTIEIPPDSPSVSHLGGTNRDDYGKILIETNHPQTKELLLLVRFAVE